MPPISLNVWLARRGKEATHSPVPSARASRSPASLAEADGKRSGRRDVAYRSALIVIIHSPPVNTDRTAPLSKTLANDEFVLSVRLHGDALTVGSIRINWQIELITRQAKNTGEAERWF